jgi:energy-coupling factor transporter ATP-binding protein EcfA2
MKILQLTAENIKKLQIVDITPKSDFLELTGPNGSGKTSVLDSIWWLLGGEKGIQAVPIRKGAEEARIRGVLGDRAAELIVERKFNASGTTSLAVRNANLLSTGQPAEPGTPDRKLLRLGSPQEVLDALLSSLSFDPLAFARSDSRSQYDTLKSIAKVEVDLIALENQNAADFKVRTDLNRDTKAKRAQADGIVVATGLPKEPVDESALIDRIEKAAAHNATLERRNADRTQAQWSANDKKAEGVRLRNASAEHRERTRARIAQLRKELAEFETESEKRALEIDTQATLALNAAGVIEKKIDEAPALPDPIDVSELRSALDKAKATNSQISKRERRAEIETEARILEDQSEMLTRRMAKRDEQKRAALQSAKMPVQELCLSGGGVVYKGLPFEQASDSEQLRVSLSIAMAANPKLRVIRIRDGSLLDQNGLDMIAQMARENDFQVWIERVDTSGTIGIVMEEGEVKSQ